MSRKKHPTEVGHFSQKCIGGVSPSGEAEHPESNRNPRRDPVHLPLMVCSTHCTAVTVLLSQTWDIRFNDFTANVIVVTQPTPYYSGNHKFLTLPLPKYRTYHLIPANQPPSYDTRQPNNKRRIVHIRVSRLLSPTGSIVRITHIFANCANLLDTGL